MQKTLFDNDQSRLTTPFRTGLLKWIGNKQRMAHEIVSCFPETIGTYYEPFVGSGAVLATLQPRHALASDVFAPLIEIWQAVQKSPSLVKEWYRERHERMMSGDKVEEYERIKARYNSAPNGADFLFLCRSCYAGVVRFRQADGYMSTPCGPHVPISPDRFAVRVDEWRRRIRGARFERLDYREALSQAKKGDLVYCDPPYSDSQGILYGAQSFRLGELLAEIAGCKRRGVNVALSIDGTKRSGSKVCTLAIPEGLFEREILVDCGRSMLRRLQLAGQTLEDEVVADRLLLTY
jgi:DNA adenine methylase